MQRIRNNSLFELSSCSASIYFSSYAYTYARTIRRFLSVSGPIPNRFRAVSDIRNNPYPYPYPSTIRSASESEKRKWIRIWYEHYPNRIRSGFTPRRERDTRAADQKKNRKRVVTLFCRCFYRFFSSPQPIRRQKLKTLDQHSIVQINKVCRFMCS